MDYKKAYTKLLKENSELHKQIQEKNNECLSVHNKLEEQSIKIFSTKKELTNSFEQLFKVNEFLINSEQESWEYSNRLSTLINNLPRGIIIETADRKIKIINNKFCKIFKINSKALIGTDSEHIIREIESLVIDKHDFRARIDVILSENKRVLNDEIFLKDGRIIVRDFLPVKVGEEQAEYMWIYGDVTADRKTINALKESNRKFNSLLDSTHFIAWEIDAETQNFTFISPVIEEFSGYTPKEWIDLNFWASIIHPDDRKFAVNYCNIKIDEGVDHVIEYRMITKQGKIKWVEDYVFVVCENTKTYLRGFFHDNTANKLAQIKLQESETKYRHLFENMTSGFALHEIIYDKSGEATNYKFLEVNPAFERLTGIKASVITGKTLKELKFDTQTYWSQKLVKVALTGKPIYIEIYIEEINKYLDVYAFCPAPNQFAVVFYDITKRKHIEAALTQSEARLKQLSDLTFEGILIHKLGKAIDVNSTFLRMTAYTAEDLIGKNLIEFLSPEKYKKDLYERAKNEVMTPYEFEIIRKDGKLLPVEISSRIIPKSKGEKVVSFRDITERKEIRQKVNEARTKAEEQERERYAKELHDGLGPILSTCKVYFRTLSSIKDEAKRAKHIQRTNELLDDAQRSIKEISNNLSPHILRNFGLIKAIDSFIEKLQNITGINFVISSNLESRLPELIEFTLYRTLVELINNSIKYSKAKKIEISLHIKKRILKISFLDNGKGFDYEKSKQKVTGFGLLNLEQRIKELNGQYKYNSMPGTGVLVKILINLDNHD